VIFCFGIFEQTKKFISSLVETASPVQPFNLTQLSRYEGSIVPWLLCLRSM